MFLMTAEEIDRVVARSRWYMLAGAAIVALNLIVLRHAAIVLGILTGPLLAMLGAMGGAFEKWKSERGLWMLSGLFLLPCLTGYAFFGWMELAAILPFPKNAQEVCWSLDLSAATFVLWKQVRFLAGAGWHNWILGKMFRDMQARLREAGVNPEDVRMRIAPGERQTD